MATAIFALRVEDRIIIAADSMRSTGTRTGDRGSRLVCKISQARGCFWMSTGVRPPAHVAEDACASGVDIDAQAYLFLSNTRDHFVTSYNRANEHTPDLAALALRIVVVGRRGGLLAGRHIGYRMTSTGAEPFNNELELRRPVMNQTIAVARYTEQNRRWLQPPYEDLARKIIQLDIDSGRHPVAPPISVLQIEASGATWIDPGLCPPIDPTLWP